MTPTEMVREFHEAFGLVLRTRPDATPVGEDEVTLRATLHLEELDELAEAMVNGDLEGVARELADVVYVIYGTALHYGIDLDAVVREVHRANMSKLRQCPACFERGAPHADCTPCNGTGWTVDRRPDGKILKGPNFRPPDLTAALGLDREYPVVEQHPLNIAINKEAA